jgi:predicted nucleotidyltransferase
MTERDAVITALRAIAPELKARSVREVWLFGSAARGELHAASDVDLLIDFEAPVTLFEFARLRRYLESVLQRPVDLVTRDALKPQLRERILREAVRAA